MTTHPAVDLPGADLLGVPYVPDGRDPRKGLDCVGVMLELLRREGVGGLEVYPGQLLDDGRLPSDVFEPIPDLEQVTDVAWVHRHGARGCLTLVSTEPRQLLTAAPGDGVIVVGDRVLDHARENRTVDFYRLRRRDPGETRPKVAAPRRAGSKTVRTVREPVVRDREALDRAEREGYLRVPSWPGLTARDLPEHPRAGLVEEWSRSCTGRGLMTHVLVADCGPDPSYPEVRLQAVVEDPMGRNPSVLFLQGPTALLEASRRVHLDRQRLKEAEK